MAGIRNDSKTNELLAGVLDALESVKGPDRSRWYTARCIFHDDHHPSLRLTANGFKCMACGEAGHLKDLAKRLDLPERSNSTAPNAKPAGLSLRELAASKGLSLDVLHDLGWRDIRHKERPVVAIPARDPSGKILREQYRVRISADGKSDGRFFWGPGHGIWPFGLEHLYRAIKEGSLLIGEGATDRAAGYEGGICTLGVPGASSWKAEWAAYLIDIPRIYVWQEPDQGGAELVRRVAQSRPDALVIVAPPEAKDLCELHQLDSVGFAQRVRELQESAVPVEPPSMNLQDLDEPSEQPAADGSMADRAVKYMFESGAQLFHD